MPNFEHSSQSQPRIKKLSPLLINQLAAGEVVTRPAAVVKELLENAIDAGATKIEVSITQGGMGQISVADNGSGILPDDMAMAITRHATSKVADVANLQGINTLGFRGEALAAIAAVSRLELISSADNSGVGRKISVAGVLSDSPTLTPIVHPKGTCVIVKDLYFNVPARRGNLKSIVTEFSYIEAIVRDVALVAADVQLTLTHDQKLRLSLPAVGENCQKLPLSRLEQALSVNLESIAKPIFVDLSHLIQSAMNSSQHTLSNHDSNASIEGWLLPQPSNETMPKLIYVNGRLIKDQVISSELQKIAQRLLPSGLGFALYFTLPNDWININVHPAKQRIKISPLANILAHLRHNVELILKPIQVQEANHSEQSYPVNSKSLGNHKTATNYQTYDRRVLPMATNSRQVQAPKQSYQVNPENSKPLSDHVENHPSKITQNLTVPKCLAIIQTLPKNIDSIKVTAPLPWLLIQAGEQFLLMSVKDKQIFAEHQYSLNEINQKFCQENLQALTENLLNQAFVILTADELINLMLTAPLLTK
ncbi:MULTISPECIES: DNA mismatch repair endonuclease MutL [Psychrobacter]|uniref:DNA mismatch repair endonuclease MutL n=1 Tax=Psychrobacter TaxID=497 RepID=UPI00146F46AF|nr:MULTISPECIES: DNA mismatch repair endonuclease MutL [Psychrobacter]